MKLYTEKEILSLLKIHLADEEQADSFVALLTPIKVPSDDEIEKGVNCSNLGLRYDFSMSAGFKKGAKWMRDIIQGGNQ